MVGMISIDGKCFRFMGPADMSGSVCPTALVQTSLTVLATTTSYEFYQPDHKIKLRVNFTTPADLTNLDLLSSSISYIVFAVTNEDAVSHLVKIYYDNSAEIVVSNANEQVVWDQGIYGIMKYLKIGTKNQIFNEGYRNDRIDWGFWYVRYNADILGFTGTVSSDVDARGNFARNLSLPEFDKNMPRAASNNWPVLAVEIQGGEVVPFSKEPWYSYITLGYEDGDSIEYFGHRFKPLYTQNNKDFLNYFHISFLGKTNVLKICNQINERISSELLRAAGGNNFKYNEIGSLAYRQVTGSLKIVYNDLLNTTWAFMKEISSDGDVSTVDVIYPASPLILNENPELFSLILAPLLSYANNETSQYGVSVPYNLPWAPHHLGVWPV